jgi:hypothetical protein
VTAPFNQALRQIEDQLTPEHETALLRAYRGLCLGRVGRKEEARNDLDRAANEAGMDTHVLRLIMRGFLILGDTNRVAEIKRRAAAKE